LLNLLAKVEGLDVASRTSSFAFKGSNQGIPQIAEELRVANVLEGSVRKAGNQVRITAQLIDTNNDRHLWSDSYDRDLNDIFQVQDEIASAIVAALKTELGLNIQDTAIEVTAITDDMDAYDLYLKGRELTIARRDLAEAITLLEEAVRRDPNFARAWAMLGMAHYVLPGWLVLREDEVAVAIDAAIEASNRALELDENLSLPWAILGMAVDQSGDELRDYGLSIDMLGKAIEADRNNATAWLWRGIRQSEAGFFDAAISDVERCLAVDPAYQNCRRHLAILHWITGDSDLAIELYTEMARSGFSVNDAVFVPLFFDNDQPLAGHVALSYFAAVFPGYPARAYANALESPDRDHTVHIPQALEWLASVGSLPAGINTHLLVALRAYDELDVEPNFVNNWLWHPPYDHFRQSRHFQRMLRDMNLPAYWAERGLPDHCRQENDLYLCTNPADVRRNGDVLVSRPGDGT
jgi:tetratricopeptide (TPR) repeat protein